MKTNFVLIDFENVQPENLALLSGGAFKVKLFLGANQVKIPLEIVRALQAFGPDAEYLQIDGSGNNALDFHIAYYIGRLAAENPGACFYVISRDTGFDPLIKHLKAQGILCERSRAVAEIPQVKIANADSIPEKLDAVVGNLAKRRAGKPRTVKTLRSSIKALFVDQMADEELDGLVEQLAARGVVKITNGRVHYELPSPDSPRRRPHPVEGGTPTINTP